jgi:hypothetical protein
MANPYVDPYIVLELRAVRGRLDQQPAPRCAHPPGASRCCSKHRAAYDACATLIAAPRPICC